MGFGGISIWQLLIVLAIVILVFGTGRLKSLGSDLGGALKGFKKSIGDDEKAEEDADQKSVADKSGNALKTEVTDEQKQETK